MHMKTIYKASDIAKYFVKKSYENKYEDGSVEGLTNLKLQKLVYFAQAAKLVRDKTPFFAEKIEAWTFGPVIPELYNQLKIYGSNFIPENYSEGMVAFSATDKQILDEIWEKLSESTAGRLVEITHQHNPWIEAYKKGKNSEIDNDSLISFYERIFSVNE